MTEEYTSSNQKDLNAANRRWQEPVLTYGLSTFPSTEATNQNPTSAYITAMSDAAIDLDHTI